MLTAIRARPDEAAMAEWFLQQPGVTTQRIVAWNQFAPHLDRKGHPGYLARRIFTPLLNPASLFRPRVDTTFSAIAQDEGLPP